MLYISLHQGNQTEKQQLSKTVINTEVTSKKAKAKAANKSPVIPKPLLGTSGLNKNGSAINIESAESDFSIEVDSVKCGVCEL